MAEMTKLERVQAALCGEPVDRAPVSFWGHDYLREWTAEGLAAATIENYKKYDWDYVKVNPRFSYFVEGWGCTFQPSGSALERPTPKRIAIRSVDDWRRLRPLNPEQGALGEELQALRLILAEVRSQAPVVQTIFTPLSIARNLLGEDSQLLLKYLRESPAALHEGLATITKTYAEYSRRCLEIGASGIFFATTQVGTRGLLTDPEYEEFGRQYDLSLLEAVQESASLNVLHVCRENNLLDLLADYPVHALSWAATSPSNLSLAEGLKSSGKAVMGGVSEKTVLRHGAPEQVVAEVWDALDQTQGKHILVGPGCSIPPDTPEANLRAAKAAVEEWRSAK